jgi:hypothetical protein
MWSETVSHRPSIVDERKAAAVNAIETLDNVDQVEVDGHRLPDGRTEIRVTVVGFTAPEPWLVRHFQDHPATIHHPVTPP